MVLSPSEPSLYESQKALIPIGIHLLMAVRTSNGGRKRSGMPFNIRRHESLAAMWASNVHHPSKHSEKKSKCFQPHRLFRRTDEKKEKVKYLLIMLELKNNFYLLSKCMNRVMLSREVQLATENFIIKTSEHF